MKKANKEQRIEFLNKIATSRRGELVSKAITNIIFNTLYKNEDGSLKTIKQVCDAGEESFEVSRGEIIKRLKETSKEEKEKFKYLVIYVQAAPSDDHKELSGVCNEDEDAIEIVIGKPCLDFFTEAQFKQILNKHYQEIYKVINHEIEHYIQYINAESGGIRPIFYDENKNFIGEFAEDEKKDSLKNKYEDKIKPLKRRYDIDFPYSYLKSAGEISAYSTEIYNDYVNGYGTINGLLKKFLNERRLMIEEEIISYIVKKIRKEKGIKNVKAINIINEFNDEIEEKIDERIEDLFNIYRKHIKFRYHV